MVEMNETDSLKTGKRNATDFQLAVDAYIMGRILCIVSLLIISTNLLVAASLVLLIRKRGCRSWCFVLNLALADILVGLAITVIASDGLHPGEDPIQKMDCLLRMSFVICPSAASILTMFLISLDRYVAIKLPLRYARLSGKWASGGSLVLVWAFASLGFLPCLVTEMQCEEYDDTCTFFSVIKARSIILVICTGFFPVLAVFVYFYLDILKIACGHQRQIRQARKAGARHCQPSRYWGHVKALRTVALLVGCFTLFWCPFFIVSVVQVICSGCRLYRLLENHLWLLGLSNSIVNPLVYACWQKEVRQQLCIMFSYLKCGDRCRASMDSRNGHLDRPGPVASQPSLSREHFSVPLTSLTVHERVAVTVPLAKSVVSDAC